MSLAVMIHFGWALLLSGAAVALGRRGRHELAHLAWLLVLVKLLIPPVMRVPVLAPESRAAPTAPAVPLSPVELAEEARIESVALRLDSPRHRQPAIGAAVPQEPMHRLDLGTAALSLWAGIAALVMGVYVGGFILFRRRLRRGAAPDGALLTEVQAAAAEIGLRNAPLVRVVNLRTTPAIWPGLQPVLILPEVLMGRLDQEERRHVLLHELAHLARGDHWVRILEAATAVLYWWLPPLVWIRRRLRDAEEACCDARVLHAGGDASTYARALLKTLDFLQSPPEQVPRFATGALNGSTLRRRLTMILTERPDRPSGAMFRGAIAVGILALAQLVPARAAAAPARVATASPAAALPVPGVAGDSPAIAPEEGALLKECTALRDAGKTARAKQRLEAARTESSSAMLDFYSGVFALELGDGVAAMEAFKIATRKHPTYVDAWEALGLAAADEPDRTTAIASLRRTIELGKTSAKIYGVLGLCSQQEGDFAVAESALAMACMLDTGKVKWRKELLGLFTAQERPHDALALAGVILGMDSGDMHTRSIQLSLLLSLARTQEAADILERDLLVLGPLEVSLVEAAHHTLQRLTAEGDASRASRILDAMQAHESQHRLVLAIDANGDVIHGGRSIGLTGTEKVVRRLLGTKSRLVVIQVTQETPVDRIMRVLERVHASGATDIRLATTRSMSSDSIDTLRLRKEITAAGGKGDQRRILRELVARSPGDGGALIALGRYEAEAGNHKGAFKLFERAAKLDSHAAIGRLETAKLLLEIGQTRKALAEVEAAYALQPDPATMEFLEVLRRKVETDPEERPGAGSVQNVPPFDRRAPVAVPESDAAAPDLSGALSEPVKLDKLPGSTRNPRRSSPR